jgi:hypothetical protein
MKTFIKKLKIEDNEIKYKFVIICELKKKGFVGLLFLSFAKYNCFIFLLLFFVAWFS